MLRYTTLTLILTLLLAACGKDSGENSSSSSGSTTSNSSSSSSSSSSSTSGGVWQVCASAGSYCEFSGLRVVRYRYGDEQNWPERIIRDGLECVAGRFLSPHPSGRCEISASQIESSPPKTLEEIELEPLEPTEPPSEGTVYLDRNIIRSDDPTSFISLHFTGTTHRQAWHSGFNEFRSYDGYDYELTFDDGDTLKVSVDSAVGDESAGRTEVDKIAIAIGQAPAVLRREVNVVTVWSGPGRGTADRAGNVSTYTDANADLIRDGFLEEFIVHEFTHTSADKWFYTDPAYTKAVNLDNNYISTYAVDHPTSEDIAESMTAYIAARYRADRISVRLDRTISATIPRRMEYFDSKLPDMYPVVNTSRNVRATMVRPRLNATLQDFVTTFQWTEPANAHYYNLEIGTQGPGSTDIKPFDHVNPILETEFTVDYLPSDGRDVFVRLWTRIGSGRRFQDYHYFGFDPSEDTSHLRSPKPGSRLTSTNHSFVWDKPAEVDKFDLIIGDQGPGSDNIRASQPVSWESSSIAVNSLPDHGRPIYVRLLSKSDIWRYRDYTLTAANGTDKAVLINPDPNEPLTVGVTTFEWDIPLNASSFDLLVGTSGPGSTDIRSSNVTNQNQLQVNIPQGVSRLYVRLWTNVDDWQFVDYEFVVN